MSDNPGLYICGFLCGLPAAITALVILYFRALAKRHITLDVEHSARPAPDVAPGMRRVTLRFDLEERKPRSRPLSVKEWPQGQSASSPGCT
jgi:hypothetical protein